VLDRAAAAVAPSDQIVHLTFNVRYEAQAKDGSWRLDDLVKMDDWTLSRDGKIVEMRRFISSGPVTQPPTDEDSSIRVDDAGRVVFTSWVDGEVRRARNPDGIEIDTASVAGSLRAAYASGDLVEDGRTAQGLRLRSKDSGCDVGVDGVKRVTVDPERFLPVRLEASFYCGDNVQSPTRQVISIESSSTLPVTPETLKDLAIGDWPQGPNVPLG
jgi:hypothetical protein